ncbi:hypothetical protein [Streptomyces sp. NPDC004232]|uniref:hypothetical protein n=1 Tax=unclassified Streptomyces TaxID=2593676 RepID=UPI0033AE2DBD
MRATVDQVVVAHRVNGRTRRSDLIGALIETGQRPARIRNTVLAILAVLLAAHHTTAAAVARTLHLLGRHPEAAGRCPTTRT